MKNENYTNCQKKNEERNGITLFIFESKIADIAPPLRGGRGGSISITLENSGKGIFAEIFYRITHNKIEKKRLINIHGQR